MSVTSTTMMDEELGATSVEAKIHHVTEIDEYPGFKVVEPSVTVNTKEDAIQGDDVSVEDDDASIASLDGCCTRCVGEWRHSRGWFDIQEGSRTLDIPASFGPSSWWARLIKVCLLGLTAGTLIYKWLDDPFDDYPAFFLAYLTHWSLIFATIWFSTSCFNSIFPPSQPASGATPSLWIKFSWLMFEVSALFNMITVILYWSLDYKPDESDINYMNIYVHTGVLLVWVEGLWVNRIPVRMRHLPLNMFLSACYVAWLAIHQLATDIGVPTKHDNDPDTNDDLLYTAVDFREKTVFSTVLVILVVFVAFPLIHWLLWGLSLYSFPCSCRGANRRYLSTATTTSNKRHHKSPPDCEATVPGGSSQLHH